MLPLGLEERFLVSHTGASTTPQDEDGNVRQVNTPLALVQTSIQPPNSPYFPLPPPTFPQVEISPLGELVLLDGRVAGHRDYRIYYQQRYAPPGQPSCSPCLAPI